MKPCNFHYVRPKSVEEAITLLNKWRGEAKIMAGGQSLGPALNLRLAQPEVVVDITAIPELSKFKEEPDAVVFGSCITHAAIEDRRLTDPTGGFLHRVASNIAYRAVRNRGTIGGSLAHADPAADWMTTLAVLGAQVIVRGSGGERQIFVSDLMTNAFSIALEDDEIITGVGIPRFSKKAKFGYFKFCRKRGEFAEAMSAVVVDPERKVYRAVVGATDSRPILFGDIAPFLPISSESIQAARNKICALKISGDDIRDLMHANALGRALDQLVA